MVWRRLRTIFTLWPASPGRGRLPIFARIVLGLILLIAVGTLLLMLPVMVVQGVRPLPLSDAMFTATSALTVTGLTVVTTSTTFSTFGQIVLLLLIQIGGVGYMFVVVLALVVLGRRVSLLDRLALSNSLGLDKPADILRILRRTFFGILIMEGAGAIALYFYWQRNGIVSAENGFLYALFHAVSAFCNAGFDLFAGLPRYPEGLPGDSGTLIIMGLLIFTGGLGIPVLSDLLTRQRHRLSINTKVTLGVVALLILVGWIGLYVAETQQGGVLDDTPLRERLVRTWFQSISTRTAGFPGLQEFDQLAPPSQLVVMGLMFIGCAPASMGGGITTGTFAVLVLALWSYARGRPLTRVGSWSVPAETVRRAGAVITISIILVALASWLLLLTHDLSLNEALFEVVSAFATCGLSLGATTELSTFGRLVVMVMMIWGRLGALTIVTAVARSRPTPLIEYPEANILTG